MRIRTKLTIGLFMLLPVINGCASSGPELETVDYVELDRFMGDWYVIASIPTFLEKGAHNAVENYELNDDGTVATTFTFNDDAFDGKRKHFTARGFVMDQESNAVWGMRFVWPIKADYRIVWLEPDYSVTVIARNKRDYVWIMARTPEIPEEDYAELVEFVASLGYERAELIKVPQSWPADHERQGD